jgi:hypothetical protein
LAGEPAAEDVDVWHRHGQYWPFSSAFTTTVRLVGVLRGPPFIRAFIAMCASNVFPSSCPTGVGHKCPHVGMDRDSGPVLPEDPPTERVLLAEPQSSHTGALEAEIEAADACKEAADREGIHAARLSAGTHDTPVSLAARPRRSPR